MLVVAWMRKKPRRQDTQNSSKTSYEEAQALVWEALRSEQENCMRELHSDIVARAATPDPERWVFISRRFDETMMWLHYPTSVREIWLRWNLAVLERERDLSDADKTIIASALSSQTQGFAHLLSQRAMLATSSGTRSQVIVPPRVIQRTSASNISSGLDEVPLLGFQNLLDAWAPATDFLLIHVAMDHASGNDRLFRELLEFFLDASNVAVVNAYCTAHGIGNTCKEAPDIKDPVTAHHKLANLMKHVNYKHLWCAGMICAIKASCPDIRLESDIVARPVVEASHHALAKIMRFTMLREHHIHGCHAAPGITTDPVEDTVASKQAGFLIEDLRKYWHVDVARFSQVRHICRKGVCDCDAQDLDGSATNKLCTSFIACVLFLMPSKIPDLGRWGTTSEALACIAFVVLMGFAGPRGWKHSWP